MKRIHKDAVMLNVADIASLETTVKALSGLIGCKSIT